LPMTMPLWTRAVHPLLLSERMKSLLALCRMTQSSMRSRWQWIHQSLPGSLRLPQWPSVTPSPRRSRSNTPLLCLIPQPPRQCHLISRPCLQASHPPIVRIRLPVEYLSRRTGRQGRSQ
jgi:hypothetical protein